MKKILAILALLFVTYTYGQNLQNTNWCFGTHALVNFSTVPPVAKNCQIDLSYIGSTYATASVSDEIGNLLFYTNGVSVWNQNNTVMPHGTGLFGDVGFQNIIIVPKPYNCGIYYVFTTVQYMGHRAPNSNVGIYYSVVNMNLNSSTGDIVTGLKNIPLKNQDGVPIDYSITSGGAIRADLVKVTSTPNNTGDGIWATFYIKYTDNGVVKRYIYSYLVSENGISGVADGQSPLPAASALLDNNNYPGDPVGDDFGAIKISPDGNHLADAGFPGLNMYNFNNQTGNVSFSSTVYSGANTSDKPGFGVEFSPNSQYVYFSTYNDAIHQNGFGFGGAGDNQPIVKIYQNLIGSHFCNAIGQFNAYPLPDSSKTSDVIPSPGAYGLQRAIDNKIYVCVGDNSMTPYQWLGGIEQPDQAYPACNFNQHELHLMDGTNHWFGLPQWVFKATPRVSVSPSGLIDYYYGIGEFTKTMTFTSSSPFGNQWYVDGVAVTGATGHTFDYTWTTVNATTETHYITVRNGDCPSNPTTLRYICYAGACPIPITDHCFPADANTPSNYCENTNSYMRAFNLGASATYSWQLSQVPVCVPITTTSVVQNKAYINIGSINTSVNYSPTYVIAKSELNGHVVYFDYFFNVYPNNIAWYICALPTDPNITYTTQGSSFDNEYYDFGNADVLSVYPVPVSPYYVTAHTVYMSGLFSNQPRQITIRRNGITSFYTSFTNNNYDDCTNHNVSINFYCNRPGAVNGNVIDGSMPVGKQALLSYSQVTAVEIFNTGGQLVRKISGHDAVEALNSNRISGLMPGIYFMRIYKTDFSIAVIKKMLQ